MANARLYCHRGAKMVSAEELEAIEAPPPTKTWVPVKHSEVLQCTATRLNEAGYRITKSNFAVSHEGKRFFGTLNLSTGLAEGTGLAIGIRNSNDRTFPMSFCAGASVFVCDNLAFSSELIVKRKHTTFGQQRFIDAISSAISAIPSFAQVERQRIEYFRQTEISEERADHLLLRSALDGIIPLREVPKVWEEYHQPQVDHGGNTLWALMQAYTQTMKGLMERNPNIYAAKTIRLNHLLLPVRPALQLSEESEASHPLAV